MKLNDEYNLKFMNHPDRVAADNRLRKALKRIERIKTLSAQTILICMPQALKELESAYENLNVAEARIETESLKEQAAIPYRLPLFRQFRYGRYAGYSGKKSDCPVVDLLYNICPDFYSIMQMWAYKH